MIHETPVPTQTTPHSTNTLCLSLQLLPAITNYVSEEMGPRFVEPMPFSISPSFNDSSAISPLVFVLSPGSDPMTSLMKFAEDKVRIWRHKC